ncbi:hypothetical protein SDC9_110051 [bioreactor metagenome]|uniref:Uncharacterized protein n=1 Tax=bioreactor metagenome TaxID=1076179 RepID=A0A645BET6_9ZZZZ
MFALGAIFGKLMGESGAAKAVAIRLVSLLGRDKAILIIVLAAAVLSYGGVSLFVCVFALYPIGMVLFKEANISKRLFPACMLFGCATFTMVATPGTPSVSNVIPTTYLGTTVYAAPVLGIITTVVMFALGYGYLLWANRRLQLAGEGFVPGANDDLDSLSIEGDDGMPNWLVSLIPLVVVIGVIFVTRNFLPSNNAINLALTAGVLANVALMWPHLKEKGVINVINQGAASSIQALVTTAVIVGFGGVVKSAAGFQSIVAFALSLNLSPFISTAVAVNIVAGITASSSGGLTVFMETLGQQLLAKVQAAGFSAQAFHRIASIASSGLDSLPHSGATVTCIVYSGLKHKEAYPFVFVTNCVVTIIALVIAVILAMMGLC